MLVTVLSSPQVPRLTRSGVLLMVFAVGLSTFGVGCADSSGSGGEGDSAEPLDIGNEVTVPISAAVADVVSHGAEPRSLLHPEYAQDAVQEVTLQTDHRIRQQIDDQPARDFSNPALSIPMTARADNDDVDLTVGAVTSPDPGLSKAMTAADGSHLGFEMSELGAITAMRLAPAPETSNAARAALEQAFYQAVYRSIMFPDEPVGLGAVWTVRQEVRGGVNLEQVTTATLTERDGNRLGIRVDVGQTPKEQTWDLPNRAGTLNIEDYAMRGSGHIVVDLGLPLPVSGSITLGGHQYYRDPRTSTMLRQTIDTQVTWAQ